MDQAQKSMAAEVARILFIEANKTKGIAGCGLYSSTDDLDKIEGALKNKADEALATLQDYRRIRALRVALDIIMPGWKYVDASDHLPREKWNVFISNNPDEWLAWLSGQGVPDDRARALVAHAFRAEG